MIPKLRRSTGRVTGALINLIAIAVLSLAGLFLLPGMAGYERYVITGASLPPPDSGITELVTHRIVEIDASGEELVFRTRGDANESDDPWQFVLEEPTQARVEATVPGVGWVFLALADREMRMLIIGVPAGIVGLLSLVEVIRALRTPSAPKEQSAASQELLSEAKR